ncbi:MAG: tryptophan synthase subunit alpha [Microthrixaceae bacterium]
MNIRSDTSIQAALSARVAAGGKCMVPYLTGGLPGWEQMLQAAVGAGVDAIEVGIPFSDPVMDGPVIQQSSAMAIAAGATPAKIIDAVSRLDFETPLAVMTYANLVYRFGFERFAQTLTEAGISGAILPDIPLEEADEWCAAADSAGVQTIMLAAPTASDERLERVVARARGFVYAVGLLGITGERESLASTAKVIAKRVKQLTDLPVLVGVGVSTPEQAAEVCEEADGVIVGSAIVRRVLETGSPEAVGELIGEFRAAIDAG